MIVNPGIRRFLGSAIQRLFNSASFYAPLTHSLVLERGTGSPNFTRATTATVRDNEGVLRTAIAGEARFEGARRVRNLLTFTEDLTNAVWAKTSVTASAGGFLETAVSSTHRVQQAIAKVAASAPFIGSVSVKPAGRNWCLVGITNTAETAYYFIYVNLLTGATGSALSAGFTSPAVTVAAESDGYYRISVKAITDAAANLNLYVYSSTGDGVVSFLGDITKGLSVARAQLEDVTAQTTQTAGEYVSVGVPSDWQGTELVTNGTFDTDTTGWAAWNSGTLSIDASRLKITNDGTGTHNGGATQVLTLVVGAKYVVHVDVTASTENGGVRIGTAEALGDVLAYASGTRTVEFTASVATAYLQVVNDNISANGVCFFDNISVKPAYYHGSFVDGIKCFATDISGNPIPLTTLLGYQAQGARTNLCLQSNAFTTTWLAIGTPAPTQNATGPDGGVTAWTLTDNDGATSEEIYQLLVLTAAAHTLSVFVGKTVGVQSSYPCLLFSPAVGTANFSAVTIDTTNGIATAWTAYTGRTMASGISASCVSYNDDFWRVSLTATATAEAWYVELFPAATSNATQSTGTLDATVTGSAVFYGAQVELGSFASSYIATTTIAVARNADVLTYSGGDIPNLKTLTATFRRESGVSAASEVLALSDNTLNNTVVMQMDNATLVRSYGVAGGVTQWNQTASNSYTAGSDSKVAVTFATNDVKSFFAGTSMTADTSATVPVVTRLEVGMVTSLYQLYGTTKGIYGWTRNLSQSELNAVTA